MEYNIEELLKTVDDKWLAWLKRAVDLEYSIRVEDGL